MGQNNARLENVLTGRGVKVLVNLNHLKTARERPKLLRKYWPHTLNQTSPAETNPSNDQEMKLSSSTHDSAMKKSQNDVQAPAR